MGSEEGGARSWSAGTADGSTAVTPITADELCARGDTRKLPALTLLAHPDLERIGERVLLGALVDGRAAVLARTEPRFAPPGDGPGQPLGDRALSRTPIRLKATASGALRFERGDSRTSLSIDGVPLVDRLEVPPSRLAAGTAVVLADRIALWLHEVEDGDDDVPPAFGLIGESYALLALRHALFRVADVDVPILVRGPTGSGKELVARALHTHGPRPDGPFVAVNLGALTPSLAVAELFGARKGAFTGAVRDQPGHFVRAHGGTLFLDEVGEAPPELQVMLLRALETGEVLPVGGQSPQRPQVRVVSATDAPLEARVQAGTFRAPLLHRLAGYCLDVPPLTARRDDIGRLFVHFLRRERRRLGESPLPPPSESRRPWLDPLLLARMARYDWPGNVRELHNLVRELVIDSRGADELVVSARIDERLPSWSPREPSTAPASPSPRRRRKPSEVTEKELIKALRDNRFDLKATARTLGVSRTGLYTRIERSPSIRAAADVPEEEIRRAHEEHGGALEAMVLELEVSERALRQRLKDLGLR